MRYRRNYVDGGTYFFMVVTNRRQPILLDNIEYLRETFRQILHERPFRIDAIVILPDHLHCTWTLPDDDFDYSRRWQIIKRRFTTLSGLSSPWQKRFWEHTIRDEDDFEKHMDYVRYNPVKHGYVENADDWACLFLIRIK